MAQLELSVVLNLANFRTQLGKLAQASAAYYYPINLTIDKQAFKKQLAALGNIKPVIKIDDSQLDAARARISTLNKSLATLRRATSAAIEIKVKYKEEGRPSAGTGAVGRAVTGRAGGEEALANKSRGELQKLYGLFREANLRVGELSKSLAKSSAEEIRQSLVPAFSDSGEEAVNGLAVGLKDPSSKVSRAAERLAKGTIQDTKKAFGIASPSRVFKEIGKDLVAGLEIGFEDFNELRAKMVGKMRELVAVMRMEAAKIQDIPMTPGMSRSAGSRGSRQYMSPIGPLPEGSQEPWAFSQYRYQPFMAQPGQTRGAGVPPMRERFPFAAAPSIMGTTTSPSMFGASFPALPSAGMTGGNAVRQAQLQSQIAAAYARSAAREASVLGESQMYARVSGQVPLGDPTPRLPAGSRGGALALRDAGAQTPLSLDYYKNAVKYSEALKVADASTRNFSASQIPLIGGIKNLAGEFGQAAKQVLLYGIAYKGLAFLTSLPGQILNAAKSQQQFANGLQTATQDTGTFAKELLYVDNVQRAFGLNLETTRTGFTRLYASMAPTGFDSGSIEKLFTGISAATASLQLTPDKAERVIYAFGQMASKGQIMSEELKGQLGDVLPGALAIFSKAAGMSVKEFSKAMEDGEFVGERFREVFAKVSDELMNRFGTGAQAAGKSLQGLINTVGGDFQRTLESFAPLANSAAQAILGPLGGSLKQLALSAQIATGEIERVFMQLKDSQQELKDLQDSAGTDGIITEKEAEQIRAAGQNVAALTAKYKSLQQTASDPAIAKQAQDITKFTEELSKAGTFVMNVAKTIGGILSPALNFLGTNLTTVISLITSFYIGFQTARLAAMALMGVLLLYRTLSAILGFGPAALSANALATAFSGLGIAATGAQVKVIGLRLALTALVASTVIGAVVGGIMLIAGAFASMRDRANEASQSSRDAAKAAIDAASTGGVAQAAMSVQTILGESRKAAAARKALEGVMARSTKAQRMGVEPMSLTMEESVALKGSSLTAKMVKAPVKGKSQIQVPTEGDFNAIIRQFGSLAGTQDYLLKESKSALATAQRVATETGQNIPTPGVTPPEDLEADKKKTSLESYASLQDQLAKDFTQAQIDRLEQEYQARVNRINDEFDLREARANSFQKEAIKFERQMADIELKKQKALLDASNEVLKARGSVAGGAGGMTTGATGLLQGSTGISSGAHFDVRRMDGGYISPDQALALLDPAVRRQLTMTSPYGPRNTGIPGASTFHKGVDLAGPANTPLNLAPGYSMVGQGEEGGLGYAATVQGPQGEMYKVGHLQRPGAGAGAGAGAPRKVQGSEKRDIVADQKAQLAVAQQSLAVQIAEAQAVRDAAIAWAEYTTAITPIEEQKLQNSLLAKKNELVKSGLPDDVIEREMKQFETQQKTAMAVDVVNKMLNSKKISAEKAASMIAELNKNMADYNKLLGDNLALQNQQKFDANMGALRKQLDIAGIIDPRKELRARIAQERTGYSAEQVEQEALLQEQVNAAQKARDQLRGIASTIGDSFGEAFKGIITGSMTVREALAGLFQSIANSFADMVAQMIAEWLKAQLIQGFQSLFSAVLPGLGAAAGGLSSGFSAGTSSAIDTGAAGWASSFATPLKFANGGIASGGFQAFANGGIVTGPTLGLVGEGRYNEAVIPLPDGKSVPVKLSGSSGSDNGPTGRMQSAMARYGANARGESAQASNGNESDGGTLAPGGLATIDVRYSIERINNVEYVTASQFQEGMRQAAQQGAAQGEQRTLRRLQQSPSTRKRIGV